MAQVLAGRPENRPVLDVSQLPNVIFGMRSITWWGIIGMMAVEGTVFALAIVSYFYLHSRTDRWPPGVLPPISSGVLSTPPSLC